MVHACLCHPPEYTEKRFEKYAPARRNRMTQNKPKFRGHSIVFRNFFFRPIFSESRSDLYVVSTWNLRQSGTEVDRYETRRQQRTIVKAFSRTVFETRMI